MKVGEPQVKFNPRTSKMSPNTYSSFSPSISLSISLSLCLSLTFPSIWGCHVHIQVPGFNIKPVTPELEWTLHSQRKTLIDPIFVNFSFLKYSGWQGDGVL